MRLEPELWEIGAREAHDMGTLVRQVDAAGHSGGRTRATHVGIVTYLETAATEVVHALCGDGRPVEPPSIRALGRRALVLAQAPAELGRAADIR